MYWMADAPNTVPVSEVQATVTYVGSTQTTSSEDMDMPLSCSTGTRKNYLSTKYGAHERGTGGRAGPTVDFTRDMVMKSKQ